MVADAGMPRDGVLSRGVAAAYDVGMIVRNALAADAEGIAAVHVASWRDAYAGLVPARVLVGLSRARLAPQWRRAIGRGGERVLVAEDEGAGVIGFGSCGPARGPALTFGGEVYTLYVDPFHQESGAGRDLMRGLFGALASRGLGSVLIWVLAGNPARFFYEAAGGRAVAVREEALWGVALPQVAYGWDEDAAAGLRGAGGRANVPPCRH